MPVFVFQGAAGQPGANGDPGEPGVGGSQVSLIAWCLMFAFLFGQNTVPSGCS